MRTIEPISKVPLVGPQKTKLLNRLGIYTLGDLLTHYPSRHFDSSKLYSISELRRQEKRAFKAKLISFREIKTRKRGFTIQTALLEDKTESIQAVWFNQKFLKNSLKEGKTYIFAGQIDPKKTKPQIIAPEFEELKEEQIHVGTISPIYPLTAGISNKWLRSRTRWLIDKLNYLTDLEDQFDQDFLTKYKLLSKKETLENIHFPKTQNKLKKAKYRLAFEEMFNIQKRVVKEEKDFKNLNAPSLNIAKKELLKFLEKLDFSLTKDQKESINQIKNDLSQTTPMRRILSGDVGTGKTIVAIASTFIATKNNKQVAILAPTTVLAEQHYQNFSKLLPKKKISLITANTKNIERNEIIIGTHAILTKKEHLFENLGLIIIDEEHKFGVEQRNTLQKFVEQSHKNKSPHVLKMTATPIPRTLALSIFGHQKVSTIKTKPKERKPIKTIIAPENKRENALEWIRRQITQKKTQVFWVAPRIENDNENNSKSVEEITKSLTTHYEGNITITSLHGRLKNEEKDKILSEFRDSETYGQHILVSTSVIEVGIDIPNANIIVIEGAEKFGLAQLHQLRGRVGRGDKESWCLLFTTSEPTKEQKERLEFFKQHNDGFHIAEFDLQNRGPGEVYGTKQSGIPNLKYANIFDMDLIKTTREAAISSDQ